MTIDLFHVQQESIKKLEEASRAMQNDQEYVNVDRPLIANVTERRTADQGMLH